MKEGIDHMVEDHGDPLRHNMMEEGTEIIAKNIDIDLDHILPEDNSVDWKKTKMPLEIVPSVEVYFTCFTKEHDYNQTNHICKLKFYVVQHT